MCQVSFFNQSGNITLYKTVSWFKKECIWQVLFMELPSHTQYTNIHHRIIIGKKKQQQIFQNVQNHVFLKTTALEQAESKANMIQQCTQLDQQPIQRAWSIFFHKPWWKYDYLVTGGRCPSVFLIRSVVRLFGWFLHGFTFTWNDTIHNLTTVQLPSILFLNRLWSHTHSMFLLFLLPKQAYSIGYIHSVFLRFWLSLVQFCTLAKHDKRYTQ